MMQYKIFSPSYLRPDICKTHKYLKDVIYVVSENEAKEYRRIHKNIWVVPNEVQGNLSRVRNYVLDNAGCEKIVLIDDDIKSFGRYTGTKASKLTYDEVHDMLQLGFLMAEDLGVVFWGINCVDDKGAYMEYTPFGMKQYIGGPFQAHMNNPLRYDEVIFLKEDYDMTIQVINRFRKNLRLNMYNYSCDQATLKGGCSSYRSVAREMDMNRLLQEKWGSKIVKFDNRNRSNKKKQYDINPIIHIPILGV